MSSKRVQKLLFSEYCDFEDMVLIESPFAQTTRDGKGLRQVHLGLTPTKLVLATDVLPPVEKSCVNFLPGIDPTIETFELIAIYPIDCVNLSIFRRRKRQALKAHFCNNRVYYFELGGFENRNMLWNLWCEKVKFLSPESGSSHSESSVGTSSTSSTLYLVDSREILQPNGLKQIWCKFGTGKSKESANKWTDRHLYMGKEFDEPSNYYQPIMYSPKISHFLIRPRITASTSTTATRSQLNELIGDSYLVGKKVASDNYRLSPQSSGIFEFLDTDTDFAQLAEYCVRIWENNRKSRRQKMRHRRRFGLVPQPLFLNGLGPWNVSPGAKFSIQVKRAVSVVTIRRQPLESELRLPVTKRQLVTTISCEDLNDDDRKIPNQIGGGVRRPILIFWTPSYWYRPRTAKEAYLELQAHLTKIREYHQRNRIRRRIFRRRRAQRVESSSDSDSESSRYRKSKTKKRQIARFMFGGKTQDTFDGDPEKRVQENSLQYLKRLLKVDVVMTAWDFSSTVLAQQITMIDRDLFLKIPSCELGVLINQHSSKNAPNVAAAVAFSHRISCLVASDVLKNESERTRARLIARFINVACKCHRISNFQSCRTILFGLQSPAIYRLKSTWAYVRKKHASIYESFEVLCRLYRDPRLLSYQKAFFLASRDSPYLPYIGDLIANLLDQVPEYKLGKVPKQRSPTTMTTMASPNTKPDSLFTKLLVSMKLLNFEEVKNDEDHEPLCPFDEYKTAGLCGYFEPLHLYEDNRSKCLLNATDFLQKCQLSALRYCFTYDSVAADYLLKARYKEERDNFFQSFRIESPIVQLRDK